VAENVTYALNVNGKSYPVTADSGTPLLWVLRDVIGLTGTKFGCGIEQCFACSVLVDGQVEHSCVFDATSAIGKKVTTIEGLSADNSHPLQQAWIAEQVPQCGYCQSGMLVAAVGLLKEHPRPSDSDIDSGLRNICACGTYNRVRKAVKLAAGVS
jgi:isoquinoline 1-oxidoreductase alpha subunit